MPSFRKHLLTWLFFLAAACVGALDFTRGSGEVIVMMLLSGIVYIAGAWAAVGRAHRLLRGAVVAIVPFVAALPFYLDSPGSDDAAVILAVTLLAALASFLFAGVTALLVHPFNAPASVQQEAKWQFSLSEILGWTIVVAIASAGISKSMLPENVEWQLLLIAFLSPLPSAAMVALFLAPDPPRDRAAVIVTALLLVVWNVLAVLVFGESFFGIEGFWGSALQISLFVGLWILCVRLDRAAYAANVAAERMPALKLHDESSDDE